MARTRRAFDALLFRMLVAGALVAGCAAGSDSATDPSDDDGDPSDPGQTSSLTDEQRISTVGDVAEAISTLSGSDADSRRAELLAFLEGRPEFEASGVADDGTVWARFTDERLLLIIVVPDSAAAGSAGADPSPFTMASAGPGPGASVRSAGPDPAASVLSAAPGPPNELPTSNQARVLGGGEDSSSVFFTDFIPVLKSMLTTGGYQLAPNAGVGEIDDLLRASGDGFFYFGGHGGEGWARDLSKIFAVTTATPLSVANDRKYTNLWDDKSLVYTLEITSGFLPYLHLTVPGGKGFYAFTETFVRLHMKDFGDHSVVYIGACSAGRPMFRQAFLDHKAGVYFGWNNVFNATDDGKATLYLVDRLLGLNSTGTAPESPKPESPPQRAFDFVSVFNDMDGAIPPLTRSTTARYGLATLDYYPGSPLAGLLAPSIEHMFVLEDSSLLIIAGKFGSQMGEVSVNRNSSPASGGCPECLSIKQWTPDTIRAEIPLSGPYSAGDVVVWSKGRMSNARRLSEWRPTFKVEFVEGFGTHRWDGEIRLHFRADVSSFRQEAGKAPKYDTVPFQIARDSEGEFVASGEYMVPGGGKDKWIGTAHLTNRIANPFSPNQIESQGEIDTESPALRLFLLAIATDGMKIINNGTDTVPMPTVWGYADAFLSVLNPLPAVSIDMDSEFRILGDTRREVPGLPSPVLFWSDVAARFVPDPKLAR